MTLKMDVGSRVQTIIERRDKHFLISKRLFLFFDFHINKIAIKFFELINMIGYLIYFSSEDNIAKGFLKAPTISDILSETRETE